MSSGPAVVEKMPVADDVKTDPGSSINAGDVSPGVVETAPKWKKLFYKAVTFGRIELRGVQPIPMEERTETRFINIFTLWWCMNANLLPYGLPLLISRCNVTDYVCPLASPLACSPPSTALGFATPPL